MSIPVVESPLLAQPVEIRHKLPPLKAITSLRFFAAMYVVLFHESRHRDLSSLPPAVGHFLDSGYTAVTLFFVLSGFILAYNYERIRSRREFWISRFARIYPLYFLSLLPGYITPHWSYHPHPGALGVVLTFCLLQSWKAPLAQSLNAVAWTLSVEAFFYASFPFLLPWIEKIKRRTFIGLQIAYLILLCAPLLLHCFHFTAAAGSQLARRLEGSFPPVRLDAFVLGVYGGVMFRRSMARNRALPATAGGTWKLLLVAAVTLVLLCLAPIPLYAPLRTGLLQLCFAFLIPLLARLEWRALTNHWMQIAGEISYAIYLLQFCVLFIYDDIMYRLFPSVPHISTIYIFVLILVSYAAFRWIEVPSRLAIREKLSGRPVPVRPI